MDRWVAITAIVCATVAFLGLVWGLTQAGDAAVVAGAVAMVLSAGALAYARARGGGKEPPSA